MTTETWELQDGVWTYYFPYDGEKPNRGFFKATGDPEMDERWKADTLSDLIKAREEYPNVVRHGKHLIHAASQVCGECHGR